MLHTSRFVFISASVLTVSLTARLACAEGPAAADPSGRVQLHIQTDNRNVQLRQVVAEGLQMLPYAAFTQTDLILCRAPCDQGIDGHLGQEYYFTGPRVTDSTRFNLLDYHGPVIARVSAGNQVVRTLGKVGAFGSIPFFAIGSLLYASAHQDSTMDKYDRQWSTVGTGMLIGGGALLVGGLIMYFSSGTSYEFEPAAGHAAQ